MNRRHLAFLVLINAVISLVVALGVAWAFEARRPDLEELAAIYTPRPEPILAAPATQPPAVAAQSTPVTPLTSTETTTETTTDTPTATPQSSESQAEEIYIVQPGDTLLVVATRYNITVDDILRANNLNNPDYVFSGQRLVIPVQGTGSGTTPEDAAEEPEVQGVEVAAVSGAGDLANEQVTVVNQSDQAFSLQDWQLERQGGPVYTFGNVPLFPGGSVRLRSGTGDNTTVELFWGQSSPVWQSGAVVRLLNAQGSLVSSYTVP